jgi:hypothetical protein
MNWSPPQLRRILRIPLCVKENPKQPLWVNQRLGHAISKDAPLYSWFYFPPPFLFHPPTLRKVFTLSPRCTKLQLSLTSLTSWYIALWVIILLKCCKGKVSSRHIMKETNLEEDYLFLLNILILYPPKKIH